MLRRGRRAGHRRDGLGHSHEMSAVFHAGDDVVSPASQVVDLGDHVRQGGGHAEKRLVHKIEPGRSLGGDEAKGQQGVLRPVAAVADVALGVQPVPQAAGVQGRGVIGPGGTHQNGDGGDETAGLGHGMYVPQGRGTPGAVSLPPGGVVGAVALAVVGGSPGGAGQGRGQQPQQQDQGQHHGEQPSGSGIQYRDPL